MNSQINILLQQAINSFRVGDLRQTQIILNNVLKIEPSNFHALNIMGVTYGTESKLNEALQYFDQAIQFKPDFAEAWYNKGNTLKDLNRYDEALLDYDRAIQLKPDFAEAWSNKGLTFHNLKRYDEAFSHYDRAIQLKSDLAEAWSNKGSTFHDLKRYDEALSHYDRAIQLKPDLAEAWCNKGITLKNLKRYDEALSHYDRAIQLKPDFAEAWSNKGSTFHDLKRYDEALSHYDRAIQLKPDFAEAWSNKGLTFHNLKRYDEAMQDYERCINLDPDYHFILGDLIHTQMTICNWTNLKQRVLVLEERLTARSKVSQPFTILGLFDNPKLHKHCADVYVKDNFYFANQLGTITKKAKRKKIRIGYFSMDFGEHAVSYLTAELFELHNRIDFEVYGFSFGVNTLCPMRQRLEKAFDKFLDVRHLSNLDIVRLSRQHEIDIAIDLGGHTKESRPEIFSARVAPIQINYLGYLGTWGGNYMDYLIGDKIIVSNENLKHFSEKIIFLPNSFQVNPSHRFVSTNKLFKQDYGLPLESFVFCCLNNNWKITPEVFTQWMQILREVPNSVLWLLADNLWSEKNLKLEAIKHGVSVDRIIFAKRMPLEEYQAQFKQADLFLDTLPYNAGTIASDALWACLPVLTQIGKSFASRVAASLLVNIGVPELITQTKEEYYSLAIELALNPKKLAKIKAKLVQNQMTTTLFDTKLFSKHVEAAYKAVYERYHAELPPGHIYVEP